MIRAGLLILLLALPGCSVPAMVAAGGVLTGVAAVTNADVQAAEAYAQWRRAQTPPTKP